MGAPEPRVISLVLVVQDKDAAKQIWDMHSQNKLLCGCSVRAIAEGDLLTENDKIQDVLSSMVDEHATSCSCASCNAAFDLVRGERS